MITNDVNFIRSYCCFDPVSGVVTTPPGPEKPGAYIPENWQGTAADVLKIKDASPADLVRGVLIVKGWFTDDERSVIEEKLISLFPPEVQSDYQGGIALYTIAEHLAAHVMPYSQILPILAETIKDF